MMIKTARGDMISVWRLLRRTFKEWHTDKASRLAAALSYYTAVAIAPLVVLFVMAIGWFYGQDSAQTQVVNQLRGMVGQQGAEVAEVVIKSADQPSFAGIAGFLGFLTLIWGASNVFVELQDSLNTIWGLELKPRVKGLKAFVRERLLSFGMILVIGFLLLISLILGAVISALSGYLGEVLPSVGFLWQAVNFIVSFGVTTLLFAAIYKVLPDAKFAWHDVWMGATVTALLFTVGKWLLGLYLGNASLGSAYGAAGSLVVLLIWIYYSAQIFFFGAEFTQIYARRAGEGVEPDEKAQPISSPQPGEAKLT
jgi:membrane protein